MKNVTNNQKCVTPQKTKPTTFSPLISIKIKLNKMKAKHLYVLLLALVLSAPTVFGASSKSTNEVTATEPKVENKMSKEEASSLTKRVEEIRDMDKSDMTSSEKHALKKEMKEAKENIRRDGGYLYLSAGTVILIVILIILL